MNALRLIPFLRRFLARRDGIAATETVFIAPVLIFMVIALVDVGLSISERMSLDHALRAGAQIAMINGKEPDDMVSTALDSLGVAKGGAIAADGLCAEGQTCISAVRRCSCGTAVSACDALCTATALPPAVFMELAASRRYGGIILGERSVGSALSVQVR